MYVHQNKNWPSFKWNEKRINQLLLEVVAHQNQLLGKLSVIGFETTEKSALETGILDVLNNSEIEGEKLSESHVRSSIAKNLGLKFEKEPKIKKEETEGAINMFIDSTRSYTTPLSSDRLFDWHAGLFPTGRSAGKKIEVAGWRTSTEPMQIVSGPMGRETVHYEAPEAKSLAKMMEELIDYSNQKNDHPFIKAALIHLWFEIIHPFEDGNGRIGRALVDKHLCEADQTEYRYYSFSQAVLSEKDSYYEQLNQSSKGDLDVSAWITWFFEILLISIVNSEDVLKKVDFKRKFWECYAQESFNDRQKKVIKKLLEGFDGKMTSSRWTRITKCTKMTATRDINGLVKKKVLLKSDSGGRSTSYRLRIDF
jgi:Fic family protein